MNFRIPNPYSFGTFLFAGVDFMTHFLRRDRELEKQNSGWIAAQQELKELAQMLSNQLVETKETELAMHTIDAVVGRLDMEALAASTMLKKLADILVKRMMIVHFKKKKSCQTLSKRNTVMHALTCIASNFLFRLGFSGGFVKMLGRITLTVTSTKIQILQRLDFKILIASSNECLR
ncbi:hypothetical protein ACJX0J_022707 [Zea mays]